MSTVPLSPGKLDHEMRKAEAIRALIDADTDEKLFLDSLEGETEALECVDTLIELVLADELLAADARSRISRLEARAEKNRARLLLIMQDKLRIRKLQRPLATLSVSHTVAQPKVTNQAVLPAEYLMTVPDKVRLGAALRKGECIEGAELSNTRPTLVLRHD